jgi:formylglycine-generating enzyme required for sulfatase activity
MKFEAKNNNGAAVSVAAQTPWGNITATAAQGKCTALGSGYDLISNAEWMTIARNAEGVQSNWSGPNGMLARGHSDTASIGLSVTDINDPYSGTGNNANQQPGSGWEQKRTLTLSNGEVIWDLAGNVWEWVDWDPQTAGFQLGPTSCSSTNWFELSSANCAALSANQYMPANPGNWTPYDSSHGLGRFRGGFGAAVRGGSSDVGAVAGAFTLSLDYSPGDDSTIFGFRCVYRP